MAGRARGGQRPGHAQVAPPVGQYRQNRLAAIVSGALAAAASVVDLVPGAHALAGISTQRRLLAFLAVNVTFMVVEFVYGYMNNSLGMLSDAAHMLLDNAAVVIGLTAEHHAARCARGASSGDPARYSRPHPPPPPPSSCASGRPSTLALHYCPQIIADGVDSMLVLRRGAVMRAS